MAVAAGAKPRGVVRARGQREAGDGRQRVDGIALAARAHRGLHDVVVVGRADVGTRDAPAAAHGPHAFARLAAPRRGAHPELQLVAAGSRETRLAEVGENVVRLQRSFCARARGGGKALEGHAPGRSHLPEVQKLLRQRGAVETETGGERGAARRPGAWMSIHWLVLLCSCRRARGCSRSPHVAHPLHWLVSEYGRAPPRHTLEGMPTDAASGCRWREVGRECRSSGAWPPRSVAPSWGCADPARGSRHR